MPSVPLPCPSQPASPERPHRALGRPGTHGAAPQGSVWLGLIPAGFSPLRLLPQAVLAVLPIELVVTLLSAETLTSVRYVLQPSRVPGPARVPAAAPCRVRSASPCLPFSAVPCPFHHPPFHSLHRQAWRIFSF